MAILSRYQSSTYSSYQKSIRLSMDSIYSQLMEERGKEPEILIIPPLPVMPDPEPSDLEKIEAEIDHIEHAIMREPYHRISHRTIRPTRIATTPIPNPTMIGIDHFKEFTLAVSSATFLDNALSSVNISEKARPSWINGSMSLPDNSTCP